MRIALQPDLPRVDVEPSVAVVEESLPDAVAEQPVKEEQAPTTPVPPVTVVQVGQVSSRDGCKTIVCQRCAKPREPLCHEYFGLRPG